MAPGENECDTPALECDFLEAGHLPGIQDLLPKTKTREWKFSKGGPCDTQTEIQPPNESAAMRVGTRWVFDIKGNGFET